MEELWGSISKPIPNQPVGDRKFIVKSEWKAQKYRIWVEYLK